MKNDVQPDDIATVCSCAIHVFHDKKTLQCFLDEYASTRKRIRRSSGDEVLSLEPSNKQVHSSLIRQKYLSQARLF